MKTLNKIVSLFLFIILISCQTQPGVYSDLNDYGYRGKVKSVRFRSYNNIILRQNKWEVKDSLQVSYTMTHTFNEDGNFIESTMKSPNDSYQMIYTYTGKIKTGWQKKDSSGNIVERGEYAYNGNKGFDETYFDTQGKKVHVSRYNLDQNHHTKTLEDLGYDNDGTVSFRMVSTFEDKDGYLYKVSQEYKTENKKDNLEFTILEKDKFNNPIKVLVKKNGKPNQIRWVTIEYV